MIINNVRYRESLIATLDVPFRTFKLPFFPRDILLFEPIYISQIHTMISSTTFITLGERLQNSIQIVGLFKKKIHLPVQFTTFSDFI